MNNDITGNLGKYMSTKNVKMSPMAFGASLEKNVQEPNQVCYETESAKCLDTLGHAKVNMDRTSASVRKATQSFMQDPFRAEIHEDFCDKLVKQGYNLEDAIKTTDAVFETLKEKDTYKI